MSKLYVLAYEKGEYRSSFNKYYTSTVEITDCTVLIDQQPFFELPVRNKKETYEEIIELSKNLSDYAVGNLLDYEYFSTHYKLVARDLSKQNVDLTRQQINFVGKLNQNATIFFTIAKLGETKLTFKQNFVDISSLVWIKLESQKIIIFLEPDDDNEKYFQTRKWCIINDQNNGQYQENSTIKFNTEVVKPNLCDYTDAYILVAGDIKIVVGNNNTKFCF